MKREFVAWCIGLAACGPEASSLADTREGAEVEVSSEADTPEISSADGDVGVDDGTFGVDTVQEEGSETFDGVDDEGDGACPQGLLEAVLACFEEARGMADPNVTTDGALLSECSSAESLISARTALCPSSETDLKRVCDLEDERLVSLFSQPCLAEARNAWLDRACVFGQRYGDLEWRAEALVVMFQDTHDSPLSLSPVEREQVVEAVRATAYEDVDTVEEAFGVVDEGLVHETRLWDASNRRAYVVFEVGAGDNSFGAYFPAGKASPVATINDGDVTGCGVTWGPERRRCSSDSECGVGLCRGLVNGLGRCVDASRDNDASRGIGCSSDTDPVCNADAGMICAGASLDGEGLCGPAWMRGRFAAHLPEGIRAPDDGTPISITVDVFGLASVDTDVRIDLLVTTKDFSGLDIDLVHASGTTSKLFQGSRDPAPANGEIYLDGTAVSGFSGDEAVNGTWALLVSGAGATVHRLMLDITSRWD